MIGAGSAGCVLAARLPQSSDRRMRLIEAGPDFDPRALPELIEFLGRSSQWPIEWGEQVDSSDGRRLPFVRRPEYLPLRVEVMATPPMRPAKSDVGDRVETVAVDGSAGDKARVEPGATVAPRRVQNHGMSPDADSEDGVRRSGKFLASPHSVHGELAQPGDNLDLQAKPLAMKLRPRADSQRDSAPLNPSAAEARA